MNWGVPRVRWHVTWGSTRTYWMWRWLWTSKLQPTGRTLTFEELTDVLWDKLWNLSDSSSSWICYIVISLSYPNSCYTRQIQTIYYTFARTEVLMQRPKFWHLKFYLRYFQMQIIIKWVYACFHRYNDQLKMTGNKQMMYFPCHLNYNCTLLHL